MPKASASPPLPLNGLFPIAKPRGPTSMRIIDAITPLLVESRLFEDPERRRHNRTNNSWKKKKNLSHMGLKIGQGGTLDPLADGVLVIGVNRGTKHLQRFLECTKEYESIGLLGASTTSMDAESPVMSTGNFDGITREDVERVLDRFRGEISQVPPIFSALKMDGKPLYEYARESKPLPRAIPVRKCTVSIDLLDFVPASPAAPDSPPLPITEQGITADGTHTYRWPAERLSASEKEVFHRLTQIVHDAQQSASSASADHQPAAEPLVPDFDKPDVPEVSEKTGLRPACFKVRMTVSSGTYVRSIVNDIGLALGCGAHVVSLTRTRQGEFKLHGDEESLKSQGDVEEEAGQVEVSAEEAAANGIEARGKAAEAEGPSTGCIPWAVWERAIAERNATLAEERTEREEALASGASKEEMNEQLGEDAIMRRRRVGPLKEWENEVLRRFVSVPVPATGSHGH